MTETLETRLQAIADGDVAGLIKAQDEYGSSWCKRGGVGAYMTMVRKVDRMEERVKRHGYDVFLALEKEGYRDGLLDDIRDLRRYLMLIEAEHARLQSEAKKPSDALDRRPLVTSNSPYLSEAHQAAVETHRAVADNRQEPPGTGPKFRKGDTVRINGFDHLGTVTSVGYDGWYEFTVKGEEGERRWTVDESALRLIHREPVA